ncbi:MAG: cytochrome C [Gammaproteobacteria bacterium]
MNKWLRIALTTLPLFGIYVDASALPSFARQTDLPCGSCHTDFPQLTSMGRQFKLQGYTMNAANNFKKGFWVPPVAVMGVEGFTNTKEPQDNTGTDLKTNNNFLFQSASLFYGGAMTDHLGAFIQGTYNASGFGPPPEFNYSWDNTDIRYANTGSLANTNLVYGVTVNNNPTVQDLWNTTPAWSFPFVSSALANTPAASPIISGGFAASVVGVGMYTYINNVIYLEATGYQTLNQPTQKALGVDPTGTPGLFNNIAPYFRVAAEPQWGANSLELGMFGFYANVEPDPWDFSHVGSDSYGDLGFDSQYQYISADYSITLRNSIILEKQDLRGSVNDGNAANETNYLNTFNSQAEFVYGQNFRLPLTIGYFDIWGTEDDLMYADNGDFSPNSNGWITEIAYIPFGMNKAPIWPWLNARIGLQYIWYNEFDGYSNSSDGSDIKASDNNTIFAYIWLAM